MKGLTFGKTLLIVIGAAALAFFGCLGAISGIGSNSGAGLIFGGIGFVLGLILTLVGCLRLFYLAVVWVVDRLSPPQPPAA